MKIRPKVDELRAALEHSPGLLLIREKGSIQNPREEWEFVVRRRYPISEASKLLLPELPGEEKPIEFEVPARELVHFRNVTLWTAVGLLSTRNGTLISDSALGPERLQALLRARPFNRYPILKNEDIPCTMLEAGGKPGNYFTWMIETLPRLWALHRPEIEALGPLRLFVGQGLSQAREELVRALLPSRVTLERIPERSRVDARQLLLLPFFSVEDFGFLPEGCIEFLRSKVLAHFGIPPSATRQRKIILSREGAAQRQLLNETVIARELSAQGFELHQLEKMSLAAQAALFNEASVVVGVHGSGFANLVYARDCRVVEIFPGPPSWSNRALSAACGHRYEAILGDSRDRDANCVVQARQILEALDSLERRPVGFLRPA